MGVYDIAYMLAVPGMTVTAPRDGTELVALLKAGVAHDAGPFCLRYPRDSAPDAVPATDNIPATEYGTWDVAVQGDGLAILAVGTMVAPAVAAAAALAEEGIRVTVVNCRFLKPISDLELEAAVENLDAGHLLLIIDACNSGQALEAEEKRRGPMNSKGLAQLAYEKGMYILTAAQSFQAALEAAQLGHGYLTYALVEEGLKTPVADTEPKDGLLIAREWLNFATERVPQMQQEKMTQGRGLGLEIAFTEGESNTEPQKRTVQRPRVFYRRELEATPLVIAKP
jgi:hypothetical protein